MRSLLTLLFCMLNATVILAQTKTLAVEAIQIDAAADTGTVARVHLNCLLVDDLMSFPVGLDYIDLYIKNWNRKHITTRYLDELYVCVYFS